MPKAIQGSSSGPSGSSAWTLLTFVAMPSELNFILFFISWNNSLQAAVMWAGRKQQGERKKHDDLLME